jgi:multidrug resistance efflux pump
MFTLPTLIAILAAALLLGWAIWFLIELVRYTTSGEYEMDQRLRNLKR